MRLIPFTQYLLPDGRRKQVEFECTDDAVADDAEKLIKMGFRFECEMLTTGEVSLTCADPKEQEDFAIVIVQNGPGVVDAVKRLVAQAMAVKAPAKAGA